MNPHTHETREKLRRKRLGNLRKLVRDRNGPKLPDDDAGREYLAELLLPISVGSNADVKMSNAIEIWAPWMQKDEAERLIDRINRMPIWERKPSAGLLGERLRVTNEERERLKLWTIAPCDMGENGMAWWRKHKKRLRMRRLRQLRGQQPRAEYLANSLTRTQPWKEMGISRRTWERRRVASPCQVKLISTSHTLASPQQRQVSKKRLGEKKLSVVKSQPTPQSEKAEKLVNNTIRVILAPTYDTKINVA